MKAVAVVNPVPFIERDGRYYMNPDETVALRCWTDHFARTVLLKPRLVVDAVPDGWAALPGNVTVDPLFDMTFSSVPSLLARRRGTLAAARRVAADAGLGYLRAPNWECCWAEDAFRAAKMPLLVELFGDWETTFLSEWAGHPLKRPFRRAVARWSDRRTRRQADAADVLCCMGEALRRKYAPERKAYITTAHLVPESAYYRREDSCQGPVLRLLYVGVLSPRKGVEFLVEAVDELRGKGVAVHLDVVGDGVSQGALEADVARRGLGDLVAFHGRIAHGERLLSFFRDADVFVLPSVGAEGLPRVIQEALAHSCPVVATDVGSVRFQLGEGRFGAVVPPGDAGALARAVLRIRDDGAYRRGLIREGYEEARRYSFERQWQAVGEILRENVDPALLRPPGEAPPPLG